MLVIQSITTRWTKKSRGGLGAAQRNATPEIMPVLIPKNIPGEHNDLMVHEVGMSDHYSFHPYERVTYSDLELSFTIGCIDLTIEEYLVQVLYQYNYDAGGSPRRYGPIPVGVLDQPGQWAQVIYNGRFIPPWEGGWWYEKHVYNITWLPSLKHVHPDLFTATPPTYHYRNMARINRGKRFVEMPE